MAEFLVLAPKDAGITAVAALRRSLLETMERAEPDDSVVLDLGAVTSADSSLAQLIISFRLEAKKRRQRAVVKGEDSRVSVSALLGCDAECEACTFNDFMARADSGSAWESPEVKAKPWATTSARGAKP